MHSGTFRSLVQPLETIRRVIWIAFLATILAYVGVAYAFFGKTGSGVEALRSNPLTIPLVIFSLVTVVLAPIVSRLIASDSRLRQLINQPPEALARDPRTGAVFENRLAKLKMLPADERRMFALVNSGFVGFVVRLAFNESIALYGLVLAFTAKSFVAILPFAIVSFALNLMVPSLLDSAMSRAARLGIE
jgi:F0F1-type ATP synthase membrane subunit c/vacuolar-type H+-ATPase subunit K